MDFGPKLKNYPQPGVEPGSSHHWNRLGATADGEIADCFFETYIIIILNFGWCFDRQVPVFVISWYFSSILKMSILLK